MDHRHDGSTRHLWVRSILDALNAGIASSPSLPSDELVRVLQELMDPGDFVRTQKSRETALADLNRVIGRDGLEAYLDGVGRCQLRNATTKQSSVASFAARRRAWTPEQRENRKALNAYLDRASEDNFTEHVLVPLFAQLSFIRVTPAGHKDKLLEYGRDLWMKYQLPTSHFIYFGAQIKRGKLDSAGKSPNTNIAEVLRQVLMMLDTPVFDPESNRKHLLDHVFVIAAGEITKAAKAWLVEKLDNEGRRRIIFMDREEILDLATAINLPLPEGAQLPTTVSNDEIPF